MISWLLLCAALSAAEPLRLSLDDALRKVVERNPDLRSAELASSIVDIDARRARLDRFTAGVSGAADLDTSLLKTWKAETTDESSSNWDLRASASVPLYAGGSVRASIDAAQARARISSLEHTLTERDLIRATYTSYWTVKGYDLQIGATQECLTVTQQALDIIRSKVDGGIRPGTQGRHRRREGARLCEAVRRHEFKVGMRDSCPRPCVMGLSC